TTASLGRGPASHKVCSRDWAPGANSPAGQRYQATLPGSFSADNRVMKRTMTSTVHHFGGMRFMGETSDGQRVMIDNEKVARSGMSPMQLVLNAVGACAGMDVSHMLTKRKLQVNSYTIQMTGERPDEIGRAT